MRKKYLSALLFGALLFASAGTFTSCKDYDDDINNLQSQIDANADAIKALQDLVNAGNYVSAVSGTGNQITFTFSNGTTQTVTVDTESGETAQTVTIGEDGELIINGEGTGFYATTEPTEAEVEVGLVKKGEAGTWEVLGEDGEYTDTKIPVSGITVSGSEAEGYVFTIVDANGTPQTVELPTAVSSITEMTLGTDVNNDSYGGTLPTGASKNKDFLISQQEFNWSNRTGESGLDNSSGWQGNKSIPSNGDYIYSSPTKVDLRIDPVDVPAENISFTLTNTLNQDLQPIVLTASASQTSNDPMNSTEINGRAATTGNGLWTLSMENQVVTKANQSNYWSAIQAAESNDYVYAVNANHGFRSEYKLTINGIDAESLTKLEITGVENTFSTNIGTNGATGSSNITFKVGTPYEVKALQSSALYDMYLTADASDREVYGLTFNQNDHTFTIGKNPDVSSIPASFDLIVYTVANNGNVDKTVINVQINTEINTPAEYSLIEHNVNVTDNANHFGIDLSIMKTALGDNLDQWMQNVDLTAANVVYEWSEYEDRNFVSLPSGIAAKVVSELANNNVTTNVTTDRNSANYIQVDVTNSSVNGLDLDKTYYIRVTFRNNSAQTLSQITVPVEFHAPALADLFTIREAYLDATETDVINAYFYKAEGNTVDGHTYNSTEESTAVDLDRYFSDFVSNASVDFASGNVGETGHDGAYLFDLSNTVFGSRTSHTTLNFDTTNTGIDSNGQGQNGYGETVTIVATKSFFNTNETATAGWDYTQNGDNEYSFKIRLMSPIYEGSVRPASGSTITISANELINGATIGNTDIMGYDYNNNAYSAVPDDPSATTTNPDRTWYLNPYIESVIPSQDEDKYIQDVSVEKATPAIAPATGTVLGRFVVKGTSLSQTTTVDMPVTVKDVWGYVLEESVPVTIQMNE